MMTKTREQTEICYIPSKDVRALWTHRYICSDAFIDYSAAFNTIRPDILIRKLLHLVHLCTWIMDFLTNRPQSVSLGPHLSFTLNLGTGSPQGCVLGPLIALTPLYIRLYPIHSNNHIIKFADDTRLIRLVAEDESAYMDKVRKLRLWCSANNLTLNTATSPLPPSPKEETSVSTASGNLYRSSIER